MRTKLINTEYSKYTDTRKLKAPHPENALNYITKDGTEHYIISTFTQNANVFPKFSESNSTSTRPSAPTKRTVKFEETLTSKEKSKTDAIRV